MQPLWLTLVAVAGVLAASPARGQEVRAPHFEIGGVLEIDRIELVRWEKVPDLKNGATEATKETEKTNMSFPFPPLASLLRC